MKKKYFITFQDLPKNQYKDNTGYDISSFEETTTPFNEQLNFKPMWAIPITDFKETIVNILLSAPNYPLFALIVSSEDYVKVDKIKWYKNIKDKNREIPVADENLPENLSEYCLDRQKIKIHFTGYVPLFEEDPFKAIEIGSSITDDNPIKQIFDYNIKPKINEINYKIELNYVFKPSKQEENNMKTMINMKNLFLKYCFSILPITINMVLKQINKETNNGLEINLMYYNSTFYNHRLLMKQINKMALWSSSECKIEDYLEIYNETHKLIIEDINILERLKDGKIERNESCPCGSNKKYKHCHGIKIEFAISNNGTNLRN